MTHHDIHILAVCTRCPRKKSFWGDNMTDAATEMKSQGWSDSLCPDCKPPQAVKKNCDAKQVYDRLYSEGYPEGNPLMVLSTFAYDLNMSCLDLGCGNAGVASMFREYTGVDVSSVAINRAEIAYPESTFYEANLTALPAEVFDEPFDLVLCCDVMEHLPTQDVNPALKSMAAIDAQKFAFGISCRDSDYKDHLGRSLHLTIWKPHWWLNAFEQHFRVTRFLFNEDFLIIEALKPTAE